jgi:hypothetical protein
MLYISIFIICFLLFLLALIINTHFFSCLPNQLFFNPRLAWIGRVGELIWFGGGNDFDATMTPQVTPSYETCSGTQKSRTTM